MKIFLLLVICSCFLLNLKAQNVGIGTNTPNPNAALDISSSNKGVLIPRLSTTARNSMTNVAKGMLVYDTSASGFYYHDGGKWFPISQPNTDSLLRNSYPGVAPIISTMLLNGELDSGGFYGTLYDNGGEAGSYASNSNDRFTVRTSFGDSTILIKVEVEEMNIESPYDYLEIYSLNDYEHKQVFTGNRTGTFYFNADQSLDFNFRSNGINNLSGFKINWTKITTNSLKAEAPLLSGWYFNSVKLAARGGANINNNWATENLGKYSFAIGQNAVAIGDHSIAMGKDNAASGVYSTTIGYDNTASAFMSTAIGYKNEVSGIYTTAIGRRLVAKKDYSFITGANNDSTAINSIFEIGNGISSQARSNAVTVLSNGNTGIGTTAPSTQLDVNGGIRTKYSGSAILNVTGTGSAALLYVPITTLPNGWDFTNTLVMVSVADGISGVIYRTKLVTTSAIELVFEANATGPTRFNYIVFKL